MTESAHPHKGTESQVSAAFPVPTSFPDDAQYREPTPSPVTSAQARTLIGSTVEIWSNDERELSEGIAPDWLGTVADVVRVGDKWHFVIQED